jgi:hypothetical protein
MQNIKPYLTIIVVGTLLLIIFLQRTCTKELVQVSDPEVVIKIDTVYKHITDTVIKKVPVKSIVYIKPDGLQYTSDENIDTCRARFDYLLKQHIARRVYQDTLKIDSLGTIVIQDTVWLNKLHGKRGYIKDYKIPFVTKTIIITNEREPVRQLYIGGNLFGDKNALQLVTPGVLYKTKKDQIYQANLGINFDGTFTYGVGAYWKISFKKQK